MRLKKLIFFALIQVAALGLSGVRVDAAENPSVQKVGAIASVQEDWKGAPDSHDFSVGVLAGAGILDAKVGLSLLASVSRKIVEPGFAPDINNGVSIELEAGPFLASGGSSLFYSAHLRWDFRKTDQISLYGLGGLGGFTGSAKIGNAFEFFPRFGIGALWKVQDPFVLRAEVSHEVIALGLNLPF